MTKINDNNDLIKQGYKVLRDSLGHINTIHFIEHFVLIGILEKHYFPEFIDTIDLMKNLDSAQREEIKNNIIEHISHILSEDFDPAKENYDNEYFHLIDPYIYLLLLDFSYRKKIKQLERKEALINPLRISDTIRAMQRSSVCTGDYTEERHQWLDNKSLEEVIREIEQLPEEDPSQYDEIIE